VYSCDYNGWVDVPEEEREAIDAFESTPQPSASLPVNDSKEPRPPELSSRYPLVSLPYRKAA
jgi:hypothetical protein